MKRFLIGLCLLLTLGTGGYFLNVYSYQQWFNSHLVATVWTSAKEQEVTEILSQKFHFCGQGSTSKAYVSEDGRFVIKTFLKSQFESKKCKHIPIIRNLADRRKELKVKYERSFGPIYAYQYIPKESGMIYYQFIHPRDLFHKSIHLIEKDGSISKLDLDADEFVIQKKAMIVSEYLQALLAKGDIPKVKEGITKLFRMTKMLYDQGIVLFVLQFLDNFGFVGDEPIRIDVEHLRYEPKWKEDGKSHLRQQITSFRTWIVENSPQDVVEHFDSEVEVIYSSI